MNTSKRACCISRPIIALMCVMSWPLIAQRPIGSWQSYLPHQRGIEITQSPDAIIYSTGLDLIMIKTDDLSVDYFSKVDGLTGSDLAVIEYDQVNMQLVVSYQNSGIDVISKSGDVRHIPNIKDNTSITGDKTVNDIHVGGDGTIYFATGFGLVELSGDDLTFGATVVTGLSVTDVVTRDDWIVIVTSEGLYQYNRKKGGNVSDFSQWEYISDGTRGLPSLTSVDAVERMEVATVVVQGDRLYISGDGKEYASLVELPVEDFNFSFARAHGEVVIVGYTDGQGMSSIYLVKADGTYSQPTSGCTNVVKDLLIDARGRMWYADEYRSIRYAVSKDAPCQYLNYDSPYHQSVSYISLSSDGVYVASGGVSDNYQYLYSREGFYKKSDQGWINYNQYNQTWIADFDLLNIHKIYPMESKLYIGSYWAGLAEYDKSNQKAIHYNATNSSLRGTIGDDQRIRVTGMDSDTKGNLWVATFGAPQPLNVRTPDGQWRAFSIRAKRFMTDVHVDQNDILWCPIYSATDGLLLVDPGEDVMSITDDRQRLLNKGNSALESNTIKSMSTDRDGLLWVGTDKGPVVFDPRDIMTTEAPGIRVKVVEDGIPAFLLADQDIRAIAVDGANRKWFGTSNGIFVQSPDGREKVHRFTADNSPLFDNEITDLAYDGATGEMYIGTGRGLLSYQTATTAPAKKHRAKDVIVYPNPVKADYDGLIAVSGLIADAIVKITDLNGRLIYETKALGGQATWDGRDVDGQSVPSGVYLIFSSNGNTARNPDAYVTKVMILR